MPQLLSGLILPAGASADGKILRATGTAGQVAWEDDNGVAWHNWLSHNTRVGGSFGTTISIIGPNDWQNSTVQGSGAGSEFYLDPADWALVGMTLTLRIRIALLTNATAPGATITAGLYPVTAVAGASGGLTTTLGTVVSGSTAAITTPSASTRSQNKSSSFTAPSAGYHALGFVSSATTNASSWMKLQIALDMKWT